MSYTKEQVQSFVLDALDRLNGATIGALKSEAQVYRIGAFQLAEALTTLRAANWIEYQRNRYYVTMQGRLAGYRLPIFCANVEEVDLSEVERAFNGVRVDEALVDPSGFRVQFEDREGPAIASYTNGNPGMIYRGKL